MFHAKSCPSSKSPLLASSLSQKALRAGKASSTEDFFALPVAFYVFPTSNAYGSTTFRLSPVFMPMRDHPETTRIDQRIEMIPPPSYDWVAALRNRLLNGGANPEALMAARKTAREQEEKIFFADGAAEKKVIWEAAMNLRDFYDWNVGE
ncbi:hypothetical protein RQP46_006272 [Phenoliferia psychrophenolica]